MQYFCVAVSVCITFCLHRVLHIKQTNLSLTSWPPIRAEDIGNEDFLVPG